MSKSPDAPVSDCAIRHQVELIKHSMEMFRKLKELIRPDQKSDPAQQTAAPDRSVLRRWSSHQIDGRRIDLFVPETKSEPAGVVLFLHGHGRVFLDENQAYTEHFNRCGLTAVCPDGGRSWWLDTVCPEFDPQTTPQQWLLNSVIPWIDVHTGVRPPRIALLGVSMGGQGVLQLAFRRASQFPVVAAISPAVDFHQLYGSGIPLDSMFRDAEAARQATVVLNLHPLAWPRYQYICCDPADTEWYDGAVRLGMKLSSSGILHERDFETSAGGHSWEYFDRMAEPAITHLASGLKKLSEES